MYYSLEKVVSLIGARRFGNSEAKIKWLLTDSRSFLHYARGAAMATNI